MNINLEFDQNALAAPLSFRTAIQAAANILDTIFTDAITVNIAIGYGELTLGGTQTTLTNGEAEAGPESGDYYSYSSTRTLLLQDLGSDVIAGARALPTTNAIQGQYNVLIWSAEEKALGLIPANSAALDGAAGFATDIPTSVLVGVALHELTHALGRGPVSGSTPDLFDLDRFTAPGTRLFGHDTTAPASYFSLDGGTTDLGQYGQTSDPGDFLTVSGSHDPFNEYYNSSTLQQLTPLDILQMDALGFHTASASIGAPAPSDFRGDGLLWRNDSGDVSLWTAQAGSSVSFAGQDLGGVPTAWHVQGVGDFNGDGRADMLWRNDNGDVSVWLGQSASGAFASQDIGVVPTSWSIAGTGDFNGDGKTDVLWRNANGDVSLRTAQSGSSVSFSAQDLGIVPTSWMIAATGDFNGDGKTDILWQASNGDTQLWASQSGGGFAGQDFGVVPTTWHLAGVGDFNGDGKTDILWRNDSGDVSIWASTGSGAFTSTDLGVVPTSWHVQGVIDVNGDGRADTVWRNDNGDVSVWTSQAGSSISFTSQDIGVVPTSWHIQSQWLG